MYLHPNPASNPITIDYPIGIEKSEFYNLLGKLVLEKQESNTINISALSEGMYIMKIHTENGVVTKKLVKK